MLNAPCLHPTTKAFLAALHASEADRERRAAHTRLAVYGTLAPGRQNNHILDAIQPQAWSTGHVRGTLHPDGWGAALGYPALVFDESADVVPVHLLESPDLPAHWPRLDDFEGPAYRRTVVPITPDGAERAVAACIYLLATE